MMNQTAEATQKPLAKYDFKNPKRIGSEEKETLKLIHQNYALVIEKLLSSMLKVDVKVEHQDSEQQVFSSYLKDLIIPTCIGVVENPQLNGHSIYEVNSSLIYAAVNRLLGGKGSASKVNRPFTELELSIASKVIRALLDELSVAWRTIGEVEFRLKDVCMNSTFAKITPDREICIVDTFKVNIGEAAGLITFCMPYSNLEAVLNRVTDQSAGYQVEATPEVKEKLERVVGEVEFLAQVMLGATEVTMSELFGLEIGDILALDHKATDPLVVKINTVEKFRVKPGLLGKYKAVMIEEEIKKT
jgi:flagellar motor switch protein FliM